MSLEGQLRLYGPVLLTSDVRDISVADHRDGGEAATEEAPEGLQEGGLEWPGGAVDTYILEDTAR